MALDPARDGRPELLSVQNLRHSYLRNGRPQPALCGVSFSLELGEWAFVLGGNGAGKSTLLNAISGWLPVESGEVLLSGESVASMPGSRRARQVAMVRQDPLLGSAGDLTVAEHLALARPDGAIMRPLSTQRRREFAMFLADGPLEGRLDQLVGSLSGGERQLLTILLAQMRGARLLLIDEGFSSLDLENTRRCLGLVQDLVDAGECGVLMVTHDLHMASQSGRRLLVLRQGRLVLDSLQVPDVAPSADELWRLASVAEGTSA
jgi:putative tryptophan/tyrosine transport system ATP-binding protein